MSDGLVSEIITIGDKVFVSKGEAEEYREGLEKLLPFTFYKVMSEPDLTEGKGFRDGLIVGVENGASTNVLIHYLSERYGKPISFIMGVSPTDTWKINHEIHFKDVEHMLRIVNYKEVLGGTWKSAERKREVVIINLNGEEIESVFSIK